MSLIPLKASGICVLMGTWTTRRSFFAEIARKKDRASHDDCITNYKKTSLVMRNVSFSIALSTLMKPVPPLAVLVVAFFSHFFFSSSVLAAPFQHLRYQLDDVSGLASLKIMSLLEDSEGLIYVVSDEALHAYDGYRLETLVTFGPGQVYRALLDEQGTIWIATAKGLQRYHRKTDEMESVGLPCDPSCRLTSLKVVGSTLWVGTEAGIYRIEGIYKARSMASAALFPGSAAWQALSIESNSAGKVWVGTLRNLYAIEDNKVSEIDAEAFTETQGNYYNLLFSAEDNALYIATVKGVFKLSRQKANPQKLVKVTNTPGAVSTIRRLDENRLIIGTFNKGLFEWDKHRSEIKRLRSTAIKNQVEDTRVTSLHVDSRGILWVGTGSSGVYWLTPKQQSLEILFNEDGQNNRLANNNIFAIESDSKGDLWLGHFEGGVTRLSASSQESRILTPKNSKLPEDSVWSLLAGDNGDMLIGTYYGLAVFEKDNQSLLTFPDQAFGNTSTLEVFANEKAIWLGTVHGVFRCQVDLGACEFHGEQSGLQGKYYGAIAGTDSNNIFVGNTQGLFEWKHQSKQFHSVQIAGGDLVSVNDLIVDESGLWLATNNGLYHLNTKTREQQHWTKTDGLSSNYLSGLAIYQDNLWISSAKGLTVFNLTTFLARPYFKTHGLFDDNFNTRAINIDKAGTVYLGSNRGLTKISSEKFLKPSSSPALLIRQVYRYREAEKLATNLESLKDLAWNDKTLEVHLSALDYKASGPITYAYRINQGAWNTIAYSQQGEVLISHLPHGVSRIDFSASSSLAGWQTDTVSLQVFVQPPIWLRPWFFLLTGIMLILLHVLVSRWRSRIILEKNRRLERIVAARTVELEEKNDKIAEQAERLKAILEAREMFFNDVAHELKTPLALISGPLSRIKAMLTSEKAQELIALGELNCRRVLRLIEQLLQVERYRFLEQQTHELVPLSAWVNSVIESFQVLAKQKSLTLTANIQDELFVYGDMEAMEKILSNLLSNAYKYTPAGGEVHLQLHLAGNQVVLTVEDNGPGIPKAERENIFSRFYRIDRDRRSSGTGIGLTLVKQLVEKSGGSIKVSGNQGARFEVTWPAAEKPTTEPSMIRSDWIDREIDLLVQEQTVANRKAKQPTSHTELEPSQDEKIRVLIVDDNPEFVEFLRLSLEDEFNLLFAYNGEEGIDSAQANLPNIIVTDVMMPKVSGIDLCKALKQHYKTIHIPIIVISAKSDQDNKLSVYEQLADSFLAKPFHVEELLACIHALINNRLALKRLWSMRYALDNTSETGELLDSVERKKIEKINAILKKTYRNEDFNPDVLAAQYSVSRRTLDRQIKTLFGITAADLIRRFRLEQSINLLRSGKSVSEVAFEVGFSSQSYFTRCFSEQFGVSPSQYKKVHHPEAP